MLTARYTPERAEMLDGIESELIDFAKISTPGEFRGALQNLVDAFDGDGGAKNDRHQDRLNQMTLSSGLAGRGVLNGSFDPELTDLALTALDAEIEALKLKGHLRKMPERRAEAFASICRQYLNSRAHHIWHWEHGGPTNLANLRLLCWFHHRQQHIHDAQARPG